MADQHQVIFQPSGSRGLVDDGKTILEASRELGVDIESICGEKRTCGKCKVRIEHGFFEKFGIESSMEHVTEIVDVERRFIKPAQEKEGYRLACVAEVKGDVLVFVPEESRAGKQIVRKSATDRKIDVRPAVVNYYVELIKPTLDDTLGDFERITNALEETFGLKDLDIDYEVLKDLQDTVRAGDWKITVSVRNGREIVRVDPGLVEDLIGLAVDIGTTTVAGYLCDLRTGEVLNTYSMMNPQVTYGEDVMSRITYAMMNEDGLTTMNEAIIDGLNQIAKKITKEVKLKATDISEMTLVCNTAMHHIMLNLNPVYIGKAPFPPAIHHSFDTKARDLGIHIHPGASVFVLPNEAGFVGADNVGVLIAEAPYNQKSMMLIIDIGTNGELILGNNKKLISSSCATGPAFEGAHIKFGMRAAPGAIERIRIDPETKEAAWKVIGHDEFSDEIERGALQAKGICGSGIIDAIAELFRTDIIIKSGRFDKSLVGKTPRVRENPEGQVEYVLAWEDETSIGKDITVQIGDIRAVQLAKGALYAGAKIMMRKLGIEKVDKVVLAGAFGSYIDKVAAMAIGMFPDCELDNVYAVGNAAGDGARIALLNAEKRIEADVRAREVDYTELTVEPDFQQQFMEAMQFPNMTDAFPNLVDVLGKEKANVKE